MIEFSSSVTRISGRRFTEVLGKFEQAKSENTKDHSTIRSAPIPRVCRSFPGVSGFDSRPGLAYVRQQCVSVFGLAGARTRCVGRVVGGILSHNRFDSYWR